MMTKFSTCSGAVLALDGVMILPATEKTRSLLLEAAGMQKMILTIDQSHNQNSSKQHKWIKKAYFVPHYKNILNEEVFKNCI